MKPINFNRKHLGAKSENNLFSSEWVTNGYFAVRRELVDMTDGDLEDLGFTEQYDYELGEKLARYIRSNDTCEIAQSGFSYEDVSIFFGNNKEAVCFTKTYVKTLGIQRCHFSREGQCAKVYANGQVVMIIMPVKAKGYRLGEEDFFPNHLFLA